MQEGGEGMDDMPQNEEEFKAYVKETENREATE